jgi:hypothetical protein
MLALAAELANEQKPVTARQLAGIMLKNVLHAKVSPLITQQYNLLIRFYDSFVHEILCLVGT